MRRFNPGDKVFWLDPYQKYSGIYSIKESNFPYYTLLRGNTKYRASIGNLLTLKEIEQILCAPELDEYFTVEDLLREKEEEIIKLKTLLNE